MNVPGPKTYIFTYLGLLGLLLINTLVAYINLGVFSTVIAIGIAIIMALLVAGILMHGFFDAKLVPIKIGHDFGLSDVISCSKPGSPRSASHFGDIFNSP